MSVVCGTPTQVEDLWKEQPPDPVVGEGRKEQAKILGALAQQVLQVPLIGGEIGEVETERELAEVGSGTSRRWLPSGSLVP